jgi:Domain of unknown function (DUF4340)
MKPRTLLVLLVVVLALGAFIWFYERKLPSTEERTELEKKVWRLEKDDVTALTLQSSKGQVRLERVKNRGPKKKDGLAEEPAVEWRMTRPLAVRADSFAVDRLLASLTALEKNRSLDEVNARDVGLDKPRAVIRLATKDGEKVLRLGAEVPPGGSLIAGFEGEKGAYVVSDSILSEIDHDPKDWRDRVMFRGDRDAIQRLALTGAAGGPVVLVRQPSGFWIEGPAAERDRADKTLVDGLLADLTGLQAERFPDAAKPLPELGLAPPRGSVEVTLPGSPSPLRIDLGAPVTGQEAPAGETSGELVYAREGNILFEARTRLTEAVERAPAAWRAAQLSAFEVHQIDSATVRDGNTALNLTRAGTDWKRGTTTISFLPVSDLLFAVTGAKASRLLTPAEAQAMHADLAKPLLRFELRTRPEDKTGRETVALYPPLQEGVPALVSGRQTVLLLPAETLADIQKKLQDVRAAKPIPPTAPAAPTPPAK